jgi:hypothetical protein
MTNSTTYQIVNLPEVTLSTKRLAGASKYVDQLWRQLDAYILNLSL